MHHEFNDRIAAQRSILKELNGNAWPSEELYGLSSKAITRWVTANRLDPDSQLVFLVKAASAKLFFLANKSQEQISPEYAAVSHEISKMRDDIAKELRAHSQR
jgi:hypothetical protein